MKKLKKLIYWSLSLIIFFLAIFYFMARYTDRLIDPYVRSLLEVTKPMGHKIVYDKIRVNLIQRYIDVEDVRLHPDSLVTEEDLRIELYVKKIRLTGFRIREMLFHKTLMISDLLIENPDIVLTLPDDAGEVAEKVREPKPKKQGSQLLHKIYFDNIIFKGGSFQVERNDVVLVNSPGIDFLAQHIELKKNSEKEPIGFSYGDISLSLTDIDLYSETGLYNISLAGFSFTKSDSSILLNGFRMIPKYDKKEFSGKLKFQNDRFDLHIGQIKFGHIGIETFLAGGPLKIASLMIDSLNADIYRDKNVTFNFDRFPPFYNESFLKIPIPVYIDTLSIAHSKILYGELAGGRPVAGTILLGDFQLQSHNLTNQVSEDTIDHVMPLFIQAMVMGEGPMNLKLELPLEGNLHEFTCSGSIGAMKLSPLNDMLEPAINMKFNEGKLNRMTFSFSANDNVSNGWMEFLYQDLDVALMKKDTEKEWGFVSTMANTMTLSNNPAPGKNLKIVEIGTVRDKNKGIINYVWKTIQSGMIHTILPIKKYQINRKKDIREKDLEKEGRQSRKKNKKN